MQYLDAPGAQAVVDLASESQTRALGAAIAKVARVGDVIALHGGLGAGKTTLARGFIRQRTGEATDVVSPTFTLVQVYDADGGEIWHFDLYRLTRSSDVIELGIDQALSEGITVIEWPERMEELMPARRLEVALVIRGPGDQGGRQARLAGDPSWSARIAQVVDQGVDRVAGA